MSHSARMTTVAAVAGPDMLTVERRPISTPEDGEILLRTRLSGICGTDLFKIHHASVPSGSVLGHEVIGTVEELGGNVRAVAVGERVVVPHHLSCGTCRYCASGSEPLCPAYRENLLAPGGFSSLILVGERAVRTCLYRVPEEVSDQSAIFVEPAACVVRGVRRSGILENPIDSIEKWAVILGGGSMGLLHLFVLKAMEPRLKIVICEPLAERRELAAGAGADLVVSPEDAERAVKESTGGAGADVVFDTAGGAGMIESALSLARGGGTVVLFAHGRPSERAGFDLNQFFKTESRLISTYSSSLENQHEALALIVSGRLDASPIISHRLPLREINEAIALGLRRESLKIVLEPEP